MLSDLAVFTDFTIRTAVMAVEEQAALFNAATLNAIQLTALSISGDFSDEAKWKRLQGLVRRRNAYGNGTVPRIDLGMVTDTMVKIAAGTPEVTMDPGQFKWIQQDPETAGIILGQQLGPDMLLDMFNTAVLAAVTTITSVEGLVVDRSTKANAADQHADYKMYNEAQSKMGDAFNSIVGWLSHSTPLFQLYDKNLSNNERLFNFGTINVQRDPFGRPLIISDAPGLKLAAANGVNKFLTLGLKPGAVTVAQNDDYTDNVQTMNGKENIARTFQAEWSYNLGAHGFAWDKHHGGKSPTDAAIGTSGSWARIEGYRDRDLGGVAIITTDKAAA